MESKSDFSEETRAQVSSKVNDENICDFVVQSYELLKADDSNVPENYKYIAQVGKDCFVEFESFPFEAGSMQYAFRGELMKTDSEGNLERTGRCFVVKVPRASEGFIEAGDIDRYNYLRNSAMKSIEKHKVAHEFSAAFNKLKVSKKVLINRLNFAQIVQVPNLNDDGDSSRLLVSLRNELELSKLIFLRSHVTVEAMIEGSFTKYINNDGVSSSLEKGNLPGAFAHWTWEKSQGKQMICDIQGVRKATEYILTDPCIHSNSGSNQQSYGETDLGEVGMLKFFQQHVCNNLCKDLGLTDLKNDCRIPYESSRLVTRKNELSFVANMRFDLSKKENLSELVKKVKNRETNSEKPLSLKSVLEKEKLEAESLIFSGKGKLLNNNSNSQEDQTEKKDDGNSEEALSRHAIHNDSRELKRKSTVIEINEEIKGDTRKSDTFLGDTNVEDQIGESINERFPEISDGNIDNDHDAAKSQKKDSQESFDKSEERILSDHLLPSLKDRSMKLTAEKDQSKDITDDAESVNDESQEHQEDKVEERIEGIDFVGVGRNESKVTCDLEKKFVENGEEIGLERKNDFDQDENTERSPCKTEENEKQCRTSSSNDYSSERTGLNSEIDLASALQTKRNHGNDSFYEKCIQEEDYSDRIPSKSEPGSSETRFSSAEVLEETPACNADKFSSAEEFLGTSSTGKELFNEEEIYAVPPADQNETQIGHVYDKNEKQESSDSSGSIPLERALQRYRNDTEENMNSVNTKNIKHVPENESKESEIDGKKETLTIEATKNGTAPTFQPISDVSTIHMDNGISLCNNSGEDKETSKTLDRTTFDAIRNSETEKSSGIYSARNEETSNSDKSEGINENEDKESEPQKPCSNSRNEPPEDVEFENEDMFDKPNMNERKEENILNSTVDKSKFIENIQSEAAPSKMNNDENMPVCTDLNQESLKFELQIEFDEPTTLEYICNSQDEELSSRKDDHEIVMIGSNLTTSNEGITVKIEGGEMSGHNVLLEEQSMENSDEKSSNVLDEEDTAKTEIDHCTCIESSEKITNDEDTVKYESIVVDYNEHIPREDEYNENDDSYTAVESNIDVSNENLVDKKERNETASVESYAISQTEEPVMKTEHNQRSSFKTNEILPKEDNIVEKKDDGNAAINSNSNIPNEDPLFGKIAIENVSNVEVNNDGTIDKEKADETIVLDFELNETKEESMKNTAADGSILNDHTKECMTEMEDDEIQDDHPNSSFQNEERIEENNTHANQTEEDGSSDARNIVIDAKYRDFVSFIIENIIDEASKTAIMKDFLGIQTKNTSSTDSEEAGEHSVESSHIENNIVDENVLEEEKTISSNISKENDESDISERITDRNSKSTEIKDPKYKEGNEPLTHAESDSKESDATVFVESEIGQKDPTSIGNYRKEKISESSVRTGLGRNDESQDISFSSTVEIWNVHTEEATEQIENELEYVDSALPDESLQRRILHEDKNMENSCIFHERNISEGAVEEGNTSLECHSRNSLDKIEEKDLASALGITTTEEESNNLPVSDTNYECSETFKNSENFQETSPENKTKDFETEFEGNRRDIQGTEERPVTTHINDGLCTISEADEGLEHSSAEADLVNFLNGRLVRVANPGCFCVITTVSQERPLSGYGELAKCLEEGTCLNNLTDNIVRERISSQVSNSQRFIFVCGNYDLESDQIARAEAAQNIRDSERLGGFSEYIELFAFADAYNARVHLYSATLGNDSLLIEENTVTKYTPLCPCNNMPTLLLAKFEFKDKPKFVALTSRLNIESKSD